MAQFVSYPQVPASSSSAPILYQRNGTNQTVIEDTTTPANNRPLVVKLLDTAGNVNTVAVSACALPTGASTEATLSAMSGKLPSALGQTTKAGSLSVALASDQGNLGITGTVTANLGTLNGVALDATLAKLTVAQSAALGTNTQALVGGSVTTAAPTYTTGNINPLSLTTAGLLRVDGSGVTQPVSGTVTANLGTLNGVALDATLAKLTVAQSAALGANTQALMGGSVTTAAPTYTTGNINPLSLTTAGLLRVDGSGVTQPVSGTVTANQGGAWTVTAKLQDNAGTAVTVGQKAMTASLPVVLASDQSSLTVAPTSIRGALTDKSGSTSATPSTSTQVAASNASRKYFFIENLDAAAAIWINFGSAATAASGSVKIPAGGSFVMESNFISTDAVNVLSASASIAFTAKEG